MGDRCKGNHLVTVFYSCLKSNVGTCEGEQFKFDECCYDWAEYTDHSPCYSGNSNKAWDTTKNDEPEITENVGVEAVIPVAGLVGLGILVALVLFLIAYFAICKC